MARAPNGEKIVGYFTETTQGHVFDYSENPEQILSPPAHGGRNRVFPHVVWVGPEGDPGRGYRYALVLKTCVHIIIDEMPDGKWCVVKWDICKHRQLSNER